MELAQMPPILKFSAAAPRRGPDLQTGNRGASVPFAVRGSQQSDPKVVSTSIVTLLCYATLNDVNLQSVGSIQPEDRVIRWLETVPNPAGESSAQPESMTGRGSAQAPPLTVSHYLCPSKLRPVSPAHLRVPRQTANTGSAQLHTKVAAHAFAEPGCPGINRPLARATSPIKTIHAKMCNSLVHRPLPSPTLDLDDKCSWLESGSQLASEQSRSITLSISSAIGTGEANWLQHDIFESGLVSDGTETLSNPDSPVHDSFIPDARLLCVSRMMAKRRAALVSATAHVPPEGKPKRMRRMGLPDPHDRCFSPKLKRDLSWDRFTRHWLKDI